MEVTHVKQTSTGVTVRWTQENGKHEESTALENCPDGPNTDFDAAMDAVEADIVRRCVIKGATFAKAFTLTGVSVSRDSAGNRQFKPSGVLSYGWGESGQSLPILRQKVEDESGVSVLGDIELAHIDTLLTEAAKYASGTRDQGELGLDKAAEG